MSIYKYSDWSFGQVEALLNVLGEENAKSLIAGELTVERVSGSLQVKSLLKPLFDRTGRRIPLKGMSAAVCDPNRSFRLEQPKLDYAARLCQFEGTGLVAFISAADFDGRATRLIHELSQNKQTTNLLKGVHLPIIIPQTVIGDYGETLEQFVLAVEHSYRREFPNRSFTNYRKDELTKQVTIIPGSRHEQLIAWVAQGPVVGIYFPNPLQGFSVDAQREQILTLPEGLLLSGGIDTAMGWVMYSDVLARDFYTPSYDCSALQWQSSVFSLDFRAHGDWADFGSESGLGSAYARYSGGLLFVG